MRRGMRATLRGIGTLCLLGLRPGPGALQDPAFTIVLIPDTQNYHERSGNFRSDQVAGCITATARATTYTCQTQWIVENQAARNIRAAIHLGDITDANGDNSSEGRRMWESVSDAHRILDRAGIPYSVVPGNHDHLRVKSAGDDVLTRDVRWFEWFFPPSRFPTSWYVDSFPHQERANRNNAIRFSSGSTNYLVVSLDFAPTKDAACWADSLARALPNHHLIVATHCYQGRGDPNPDSTRTPAHQKCTVSYKIDGMDGEDLWNELLSLHSNIRLVVSGHVQAGANYGMRASAAGGQPVHELLVDYQEERFAGGKHGAGWMRLLQLDPAAGRLRSAPINVLGRTTFNARETSDLCDGDSRPRCYVNDPAHRDHTFDTPFAFTLPTDRHAEPESFIDRYLNEDATGNQTDSRLAMTSTGDFVATWRDDSEAPSGQYEIFGRSFRRDGCSRSGGYRVNQNSHRQQREPDVGIDATGRTVTVWADDSRGAEGAHQIYARGMHADGRQRFYPFTVNQDAAGDQRSPRVAVASNGRFVVTWRDTRDDGGDIFARGFNADGSSAFDEIRVNATRTGVQDVPDVAITAAGSFVVVWRSGSRILTRSFSATGAALGDAQTVAEVTGAGAPAVAATPTGNAVVAWRHGSNAIRERRLAVGGAMQNAVVVYTAGSGVVDRAAVDIAPTGEFAVAWQDDADGNGSWQVKARAFNRDGSARGPAMTVNKNARGQQTHPAVAVTSFARGLRTEIRWVVSWTDDLDRNGVTQIMARGQSFTVPNLVSPT